MLLRHTSPPKGVFRGVNFMTPTILEYGTIRPDSTSSVRGALWYELSEGRGLDDEPIFGVTFRTPSGAKPNPDLSKLFHSRANAVNYIRRMAGDPPNKE